MSRRITSENGKVKIHPNGEDLKKLWVNDSAVYVAIDPADKGELMYKLHKIQYGKTITKYKYKWLALWNSMVYTGLCSKLHTVDEETGIDGFDNLEDAINEAISRGYTVKQIGYKSFDMLLWAMKYTQD